MTVTDLAKPFLIRIAILICLIGFLLTALTGWIYYSNLEQKEKSGYTRARQQAQQVAEVIDEKMLKDMSLTQAIADKLSSGALAYDETLVYLQDTFEQHDELLGISVAFAPYAYAPDARLYAPYLLRNARGEISLVQIDQLYDYTDLEVSSARWYTWAIQEGAPVWTDPYYGKASDDVIFTYSLPFKSLHDPDEYAGVVVIAQSVTGTFKQFTQNADLGYGGYLFLVNAKNKIIYHPELDLISTDASALSKRIKGFKLDDLLASVEDRVQEKKFKGKISFLDAQTGQLSSEATSWFFTHSLANSAGWKAVVVIDTLDTTYDPKTAVRQLVNIYLALLVLSMGMAMLVFRIDLMTTPRLMGFSVTLGCIFLFGILWIWYVIYSHPELNHQKVLVNEAGINRALGTMQTAFQDISARNPEEIPTGILIENLTMTNQSVKVSGYLWQKFPPDFPEKAINFPQLTDQVGGLIQEEVYRYTKDGQQLVGWFFSTEIQQRLNNQLYPLDQSIIKIQIEPSTLSDKYVLVPATLDYDYMSPGYKPGLSSGLNARGWIVKNSFFTYDLSGYGTNFGLFRQVPKEAIPNLVFNIRMTRDILSPIIAYCIVIYIVVMQVYGISVLKIDNPYQVLSIAAALFLVVAITHTGMRDSLGITGVVYLEYYFILLYLTILATSVNAIMWAVNIQLPLLTYRDNLAIKVLFWPAFLGIGLVFTLITFYPFY